MRARTAAPPQGKRRVVVLPGAALEAQCVAEVLSGAGFVVSSEPGPGCAAAVVVALNDVDVLSVLGAHRSTTSRVPTLLVVDDLASSARAVATSCGVNALAASSSTSTELVAALGQLVDGTAPPVPQALPDALTMRESEIVDLVARGFANHAIAAELGISPHTVRTHVQNIMSKLRVRHRHALVARSSRAGAAARHGKPAEPAPARR